MGVVGAAVARLMVAAGAFVARTVYVKAPEIFNVLAHLRHGAVAEPIQKGGYTEAVEGVERDAS